MDYPVSVAAPRTWRGAALAASTVAVVELLILVTIGVVWFAHPLAKEERARAESNAAGSKAAAGTSQDGKTGAPSLLPRSRVSVVVLNGNGIPGAADQASSRVRRLHYVVTGAANAPRSDFRRTLVMYRPGFKGEALRLAKDVGARRVAPLDGMRPSDLMGARVALILGRR